MPSARDALLARRDLDNYDAVAEGSAGAFRHWGLGASLILLGFIVCETEPKFGVKPAQIEMTVRA